jgi:hypothetical protein
MRCVDNVGGCYIRTSVLCKEGEMAHKLLSRLFYVGVLHQVYRACVDVSNNAYAQEPLELCKGAMG